MTWVLLVLMVRLVLKEIVEKQREDKRCLILCQRVTKENLVPLALVVFQVVLGLRVRTLLASGFYCRLIPK